MRPYPKDGPYAWRQAWFRPPRWYPAIRGFFAELRWHRRERQGRTVS